MATFARLLQRSQELRGDRPQWARVCISAQARGARRERRRENRSVWMKAAVLRSVGQLLSIEEIQIDLPAPHEVLIRTAAAGVCHSDLHFLDGSYPCELPTVLGHEAAGIVEKVGAEVTSVK